LSRTAIIDKENTARLSAGPDRRAVSNWRNMDTSKLLFKGYDSRELDKVGKTFMLKTGCNPKAFVIRPGYAVSGSKENQSRVVVSRTCASDCVMVPLLLNKAELEKIYSDMAEPSHREKEEELSSAWGDDLERQCKYCSRLFRVEDWSDRRLICDNPECIAREKNRLEESETVKKTYKSSSLKTEDENKAELVESITADEPHLKNTATAGYVYLIQADNDLSKIGHTDDVWKRFSDLVTMNAAGLSLRHTIRASNRYNAEQWLHGKFRNKKIHHEWFRLTNEDISWFASLQDGALDGI
jgi:hypothetical protein